MHHVLDLGRAAHLVEAVADPAGVHAHGGLAEGCAVEEGGLLPLLEHHAAGEAAVAVHNDLVRHDEKRGARTRKAGYLTLLVGDAADIVVVGVMAVGCKVKRGAVLGVVAVLHRLQRNNHIFEHFILPQSRKAPSPAGEGSALPFLQIPAGSRLCIALPCRCLP